MKKKIASILLLLQMLLITPAIHAEVIFKYGIPVHIDTLDPHGSFNPSAVITNAQIYQPLFAFLEVEPTPILATSWQRTDPTTIVMTLRKGVKFHDGSPFDANDVVFSFHRVQQSRFKTAVANVTDIKALDDYTVEITLKNPDPLALRKFSSILIMSEKWAKKHHAEVAHLSSGASENPGYAHSHTNGTGAFKLDKREAGVVTELVRFNDYWDNANVTTNIDRIQIYPLENNATRVSALISGEIDFTTYIAPSDVEQVKAAKGIKVHQVPTYASISLGLNSTAKELPNSNIKGKNPFADIRVRKAVYHAIPMPLIIDKILQKENALLSGTVAPPTSYGYTEALNQRLPYDLEKAKKLLAEAGYPDGFDITIACNETGATMCYIFAGVLSKANIHTTIDVQPTSRIMNTLDTGKMDAYFVVFFDLSFDASLALTALYHPDGAGNFQHYSNPELTALIDQQRVELDVAKRKIILNKALTMANETYIYIPLFFPIFYWGAQENIEIPDNRLSFPLFQFIKKN